ncbi:hypothetical protein [Novosphingobium mangrovi (ex Hu et al. 2023)]|uniref:Uncharacterized protein n=1 Tax=Novosphingobium mangrovi (ex Hu et al. 2023) TaxID=2930094 RepID=A0ABT0AGZ3_9SPHN|nr:hypothetical protein [Novosphingobium mangrovi (ex Hu et al. 2023)]MCJ1962442.1 hypothetical protein [Novosphingobium mangrovi (ex Hu et al. 2023)]
MTYRTGDRVKIAPASIGFADDTAPQDFLIVSESLQRDGSSYFKYQALDQGHTHGPVFQAPAVRMRDICVDHTSYAPPRYCAADLVDRIRAHKLRRDGASSAVPAVREVHKVGDNVTWLSDERCNDFALGDPAQPTRCSGQIIAEHLRSDGHREFELSVERVSGPIDARHKVRLMSHRVSTQSSQDEAEMSSILEVQVAAGQVASRAPELLRLPSVQSVQSAETLCASPYLIYCEAFDGSDAGDPSFWSVAGRMSRDAAVVEAYRTVRKMGYRCGDGRGYVLDQATGQFVAYLDFACDDTGRVDAHFCAMPTKLTLDRIHAEICVALKSPPTGG